MAARILPIQIDQFLDDNGQPLASGRIYSFEAGTQNGQPFFTDSGLTTEFDNPIVLDDEGRPSGPLYMPESPAYDLILLDANGVTIWTAENITSCTLDDGTRVLAMPVPQFVDDDGAPLAGGFLYAYATDTLDPHPLYTDSDLEQPYPNPIELDMNGRPDPGVVYLAASPAYDLVLKDRDGNTVWTASGVENCTFLEEDE